MSDWKALATAEAKTQNCDLSIVLATVEAESVRNITGDNGNAVGYGQVWFKWHKDAFQYASKRFGLPIPTSLEQAKQIALSNDAYSMAVAVFVIKKDWIGASKNWDRFTEFYVSKNIPDKDRERRRKIWQKYSGSTGTVFDSPYSATEDGVTFEQTDTQIVSVGSTDLVASKNITLTGDIIYGRRCRVLVTSKNGQTYDLTNLKCVFNIIKTFQIQANYSVISIYNLSPEVENAIISTGSRIVIEAGYEGDQYGVIYDGDITSVSRTKEDGVNYKLTIQALDGDMFLNYGLIGFTFHRGQTQRSVATQIATKATKPSQIGEISDDLGNTKLIRGKTVFGKASTYLRQIAQSNNATFHVLNGKTNIVKASSLPKGTVFEISPTSGLIDYPVQQDYGMACKVMLNPRIEINTQVHVDNSIIEAMHQQQGQIYRELDKEGIYRVIKINHVGDTYGDDWYTSIETITQAGYLPSMIANPGQSPW